MVHRPNPFCGPAPMPIHWHGGRLYFAWTEALYQHFHQTCSFWQVGQYGVETDFYLWYAPTNQGGLCIILSKSVKMRVIEIKIKKEMYPHEKQKSSNRGNPSAPQVWRSFGGASPVHNIGQREHGLLLAWAPARDPSEGQPAEKALM